MPIETSQVLSSLLGGGIGGVAYRVVEKWIEARLVESRAGRDRLRKFARPLWLQSHELEFRLDKILLGMRNMASLEASPSQAQGLDWYTKDGYFSTSTAYLFASVAAWVHLYRRDVVFLEFRGREATGEFFRKVERFKEVLSSSGSILWYHYIDGMGERLVSDAGDRPVSLATFSQKLYTDALFRAYYDQLFQFLAQVAGGQHRDCLSQTRESLRDICGFLEKHEAIPMLASADAAGMDPATSR